MTNQPVDSSGVPQDVSWERILSRSLESVACEASSQRIAVNIFKKASAGCQYLRFRLDDWEELLSYTLGRKLST